MSRGAQRLAAFVVGTTVLAALITGAIVARSAYRYPDRSHRPGDETKVKVVIARGMSPATIARQLVEKDLLERPTWFRLYANERGDAQRIRAGQYTFSPSMTPRQILDALLAGTPE
jgi:UPF0755 protein